MKFVLPGGSGQLGPILARAWRAKGHEVVVLGRRSGPGIVTWDGKTPGDWCAALEGADVVLNLAGRTVNCRYTEANLAEMLNSRVDSTRVVGAAIGRAAAPPRLWLQMATATIYAHRHDAGNDEATGIIGGSEHGVPAYWARSVEIGKAWEAAQDESDTPRTRKVALRSSMVMSPDRGGVFDVLFGMTRLGLGGSIGGGKQFVSWLHEADLLGAIEFLIEREDLSGPVNLAAPSPLPQGEFMAALREAGGIPVGLPATAWMAEIGAFFLRTDTELLLKSRRVVPGRLTDAGYRFAFPEWAPAARDLVARWRAGAA